MISLDKDQVNWMEHHNKVGDPKAILEAFFGHISRKTDLKDWSAYVRYFEDNISYWQAVYQYRSEITKIIFRFVPPNAFEGEHLAQRFYTAIQKQANNEILETTFKSEPGRMNPDAPLMRESAEIAEQGAGERELRGRRNRLLYSSGRGRQTDSVPEEEMPTIESPTFVKRVIARLFG